MANADDIIGYTVGIVPDPYEYGRSEKLVDNSTAIGIEIELEHFSNHKFKGGKALAYWYQVNDGSLKLDGVEFVSGRKLAGSYNPVTGVNIINALEEIKEHFKYNIDRGYSPSLSKRTSVHIHMDVRDMTFREVYRLVVLYMTFEKVFSKFCGEGRYKNAFCIPLANNGTLRSGAETLLSNDTSVLMNIATKYDAMNLHSIVQRGSVEFRMHEGCIDTDKILAWINTLLSLKVASKKLDINPKHVALFYSEQGHEGFINSIFDMDHFNKWLRYDGIEMDLVEGMRYSQDMEFSSEYRSVEKAVYTKGRFGIGIENHLISAFLKRNGEEPSQSLVELLTPAKPREPTAKKKVSITQQ
jgi:hypothetical protein